MKTLHYQRTINHRTKKCKQWRHITKITRHNQMSGKRERFVASNLDKTALEKRVRTRAAGRDRGHPSTCCKRRPTKTRNSKCVLASGGVSCVITATRLALHPREHAGTLDVVDDGVHKVGALRTRLVPLRVYEGGVHALAQELLVEQEAVGDLHCGIDTNQAVWTRKWQLRFGVFRLFT